MKQIVFLCMFISLLFTSCDKGVIYEHTENIPNGTWEYGKSLSYEIMAPDTSQYYELVLNLEHSTEFSYQNLYTKITTSFPSGKKLDETISLQIANKMGSWLGNCSSKTCSVELVLQEGFRFKEEGIHVISFENYSRESLEGIESVELKLYSYDEM